MLLHQLPPASRRTKDSAMLYLPSRLGLSPALSRPWTSAVAAWFAQDRLPRLAILGPPTLLPPIWFSRTTTALACWKMPSSGCHLPDVKENSHRGCATSRSRTQPLLRLLYALHEQCVWTGHPERAPRAGTQNARPNGPPIGPKHSLRACGSSAFSVVSRPYD